MIEQHHLVAEKRKQHKYERNKQIALLEVGVQLKRIWNWYLNVHKITCIQLYFFLNSAVFSVQFFKIAV